MYFFYSASLVLKLLRAFFWLDLPLRIMASVSCLPTRIIGIEAGHGVLEYHRDLIAAKLMEILLAHLEKILSVVYYLAAVDYGVAARMPIIARLVTDFPLPDSPTRARVSPR